MCRRRAGESRRLPFCTGLPSSTCDKRGEAHKRSGEHALAKKGVRMQAGTYMCDGVPRIPSGGELQRAARRLDDARRRERLAHSVAARPHADRVGSAGRRADDPVRPVKGLLEVTAQRVLCRMVRLPCWRRLRVEVRASVPGLGMHVARIREWNVAFVRRDGRGLARREEAVRIGGIAAEGGGRIRKGRPWRRQRLYGIVERRRGWSGGIFHVERSAVFCRRAERRVCVRRSEDHQRRARCENIQSCAAAIR